MNPSRWVAGSFPRNKATLLSAAIFVLLVFTNAYYVKGQQRDEAEPAPQTAPQPEVEEDPTKPVFFSIRNEYRDLRNGGWANTVLFRVDKLSFRNLRNKGGAKGVIFRFDFPLNTVHNGTVTKAGLGDLYTPLLYIPRARGKFSLVIGSGIVFPTATNDLLGRGKLIVAPTAIPIWYLKKRKRLALIRFQNYVAVAGKSSRPDVNYFIADPTIAQPITRKWWVGINTEFKWDWQTSLGSGISGLQVGRIARGKYGFLGEDPNHCG